LLLWLLFQINDNSSVFLMERSFSIDGSADRCGCGHVARRIAPLAWTVRRQEEELSSAWAISTSLLSVGRCGGLHSTRVGNRSSCWCTFLPEGASTVPLSCERELR
jgi:hypothetical protein